MLTQYKNQEHAKESMEPTNKFTIDGDDGDDCLGHSGDNPPRLCVDWQVCLPGYHHIPIL
jgi:hypothetical protein